MADYVARSYALTMCRAWVFGKKIGGQRIHLCGREKYHKGKHECYCGHTWTPREGGKLCHTWRPGSLTALDTMQPGKGVTEATILELFGKRKLDVE